MQTFYSQVLCKWEPQLIFLKVRMSNFPPQEQVTRNLTVLWVKSRIWLGKAKQWRPNTIFGFVKLGSKVMAGKQTQREQKINFSLVPASFSATTGHITVSPITCTAMWCVNRHETGTFQNGSARVKTGSAFPIMYRELCAKEEDMSWKVAECTEAFVMYCRKLYVNTLWIS